MSKGKWWIKILVFIFCFAFVFVIQRQNFLKPEFIDEQDNFVVGKNINEGNKVYTNIFSHHQPGTYVLSALIQKVFRPNLIQVLILRHRQFVFIWSILWMMIIGWRFGMQMIIPLLIFELVKNKYLGSLFLAESLVAAPMIYLVLTIIRNKLFKYEPVWWGIVAGYVGISLAPMWPAIGLMILVNCFRWKKATDKTLMMLFSGGGVVLITMFWIDLKGYFENAILINQKYYIAIAGGDNLAGSFFKSILTPVQYLFNGVNQPEILLIKTMIWLFIFFALTLLYKRRFMNLFIILLILTLTNLRNFEMEKLYHSGFHLLIWLGLVVSIPFVLINKKFSIIGMFLVLFYILLNRNSLAATPKYQDDFEIYYSRIFNMSEAIRSTKNSDDELMTMPGGILGYWQSGIKPAGRFIFFYKWMTEVDELKDEQMKNIANKPEYLIIPSKEGLNFDEIMPNYINFKYRGSDSSEFYIRKDVYDRFSKDNISKLNYYGLEAI